MSLIHPHIRSHRAMAKALEDEIDHLRVEAPVDTAGLMRALGSMANAYRAAANDLEKQEKDLLDKVVAL